MSGPPIIVTVTIKCDRFNEGIMAVKFDKEALLKHRFWVLVAVTSCVTLAGIGYLQLYGSSEANKKRGDMATTLKNIEGTKASSNQEVIAHWNDKAAKAKEQE